MVIIRCDSSNTLSGDMRHQHRVSHALWSFELLCHPGPVLDCRHPQTVGHQDFSGENFLPEFHSGVIWTWTFCLTVRLFASILAPLCTNGLFCPAPWWPVHKSLASPTTRQNTSSHKFWFHFFLGRYRFQLLIASHWFLDIFTQDTSSKAGIHTGKRQSLLILSRNTLAQIFFFQSRPLHTTISFESYKCHHSESKVLLYSQFYSRPSGHKWRINLFSDISLSYFTDDWIGSVFVLG